MSKNRTPERDGLGNPWDPAVNTFTDPNYPVYENVINYQNRAAQIIDPDTGRAIAFGNPPRETTYEE